MRLLQSTLPNMPPKPRVYWSLFFFAGLGDLTPTEAALELRDEVFRPEEALDLRDEVGLVTLDGLLERELVVLFVRLFAGLFDRPRTPAPLAWAAFAGLRERSRVLLVLVFFVGDAAFVGLCERARVAAFAPLLVPLAGLSRPEGALFFFPGGAGLFDVERLGGGLAGLLDLSRVGAAFCGLFDWTRGVGGCTYSSALSSLLRPSSTSKGSSSVRPVAESSLSLASWEGVRLVPAFFDAAFFGLAFVLVTLPGDAFFGGRPRGFGEAVVAFVTAVVASFRGLPLGLGVADADFAGETDAAFLGDGDFVAAFFAAEDTLFLAAGDLAFEAVGFFVAGEAVFLVGRDGASSAALMAFFAAEGFFKAFASFLTVEVFLAGDAFLVTFAASSASAFFADCTAFLGERRTGGLGVTAAFALPVAFPFFGDEVVFAFAMMYRMKPVRSWRNRDLRAKPRFKEEMCT